jgi:hypothetical protein
VTRPDAIEAWREFYAVVANPGATLRGLAFVGSPATAQMIRPIRPAHSGFGCAPCMMSGPHLQPSGKGVPPQ